MTSLHKFCQWCHQNQDKLDSRFWDIMADSNTASPEFLRGAMMAFGIKAFPVEIFSSQKSRKRPRVLEGHWSDDSDNETESILRPSNNDVFLESKFYAVETIKNNNGCDKNNNDTERSIFRLDRLDDSSKRADITWCYSKTQARDFCGLKSLPAGSVDEEWYISTHFQANFPLDSTIVLNDVKIAGVFDIEKETTWKFDADRHRHHEDADIIRSLLYRGHITSAGVQKLYNCLKASKFIDVKFASGEMANCQLCYLYKPITKELTFDNGEKLFLGKNCAKVITNLHDWMHKGRNSALLESIIQT